VFAVVVALAVIPVGRGDRQWRSSGPELRSCAAA